MLALLEIVCSVLAFIIKALGRLTSAIARVLAIVLVFASLIAIWHFVGTLPIFWQSFVLKLTLFGGAASFICIVALRIWKPEKFSQIFS